MSSLKPLPSLMEITPYKGGESKIDGVERIIKLSSNEGPFGPSPLVIRAIQETAAEQHRYPDGAATALRHKIGETFEIEADHIICGAGSDEIIGLLCRAYAGPGDEVLYSEHGFLMYPIAAKTAGALPVKAPEKNLCSHVDSLLSAVTEKTKIVFIANPNNPTGTYLSKTETRRLRENLRDDILLVLDGAYAEYVTQSDYDSGIELVRDYDNVVMTRTFSKLFGLGGMRLGWSYAGADITDVLNRARNPFNVSATALSAGVAALSDKDFIEASVAHNQMWLRWLEEKWAQLGLTGTQSFGNFSLIHFPEGEKSAQHCDAYMRERGIIVRAMSSYGLPGSLRVSIGLEDDMKTFVRHLENFMNGSGA